MHVKLLKQPGNEEQRIGDFLNHQLSNESWTHFYFASAFVKRSGVKHIAQKLASFSDTHEVKVICGVDMGGTSVEGVEILYECIKNDDSMWFFHNEAGSTFHPKMYLFFNDDEASVAIGSGNMTEGGLFTNYEMGAVISLDRTKKKDEAFLSDILNVFDSWSVNAGDKAMPVSDGSIKELLNNGYLVSEPDMQPQERKAPSRESSGKKLFGKEYASPPPSHPSAIGTSDPVRVNSGTTQGNVFLMTLQQTDVGGKENSSPEVFIPLRARDHNKSFWGWKGLFREDSGKPGKFDRKDVQIILDGKLIIATLMTWPDKSDFRLRSTEIRKSGEVGDILKLKKLGGRKGPKYQAEIIQIESKNYEQYKLLCNHDVRNSEKTWGYYDEQG